MGAAFSRAVLGVDSRVALLSVGEEAKKGTPIVEANAELSGLDGINFIGNIEGRDLLAGAAEVIATDGFTGNVALKTLEGTAKTVGTAVGSAARSNPVSSRRGRHMLRPALGGLRREMDPDTTGSISHGEGRRVQAALVAAPARREEPGSSGRHRRPPSPFSLCPPASSARRSR